MRNNFCDKSYDENPRKSKLNSNFCFTSHVLSLGPDNQRKKKMALTALKKATAAQRPSQSDEALEKLSKILSIVVEKLEQVGPKACKDED